MQSRDNLPIFLLQVVGKWFNSLELNLQDVVWNHAQELPTSACSLPCEAGMIKKQQVSNIRFIYRFGRV